MIKKDVKINNLLRKEKNKNNTKINKDNVKIISTLGKDGFSKIYDFYKNGTDILRINGSHIKSSKDLLNTLTKVNTIINNKCKDLEVMYDTQGPEIRTRIVSNNKKNNSYFLNKNDNIAIHTDVYDKSIIFNKENVTKKRNQTIHIGVNYCEFLDDVNINDLISIDNRKVYAKVSKIDFKKKIVFLKVIAINNESGSKYNITDRMHINLLGKPVSQPTLTKEDEKYIKIAIASNVKYYAISFVRNARDIIETRKIIISTLKNMDISNNEIAKKMKDIKIIAKIETKQGLDNIEEIVKEADGAMVARGDLSCEISLEEVPYAKEKIITTCNKYKKFSILATNVLESLIHNRLPSVNDIDVIATSLKSGINAIMLSDETAIGKYSLEAICELKKHIDFYKKNINSNGN